MATGMSKIALIAGLVALFSCTPSGYRDRNRLLPEMAVEVNPPEQYNKWLEEVQGCVIYVATQDTTFKIAKLFDDAHQLTWIILSTERENGTIPCIKDKIEHSCYALSKQDTIIVSAQYARNMSVIKHELMHQIVDSPRETLLGPHGPPWGFCEYLW